ncbi:hypothetical protein K456DRAFT_55662 [Colletotrichum gloeosporioides 23]|nr:hypothetical protein K456DRAFT_55662 [Colletotrichum gloeosporioides 23]
MSFGPRQTLRPVSPCLLCTNAMASYLGACHRLRDDIYQTTEAVPPIAIRGPRKTRDALLRLDAGAFIKPLGILLASRRLIWPRAWDQTVV